jgi:hypothetical protein
MLPLIILLHIVSLPIPLLMLLLPVAISESWHTCHLPLATYDMHVPPHGLVVFIKGQKTSSNITPIIFSLGMDIMLHVLKNHPNSKIEWRINDPEHLEYLANRVAFVTPQLHVRDALVGNFNIYLDGSWSID